MSLPFYIVNAFSTSPFGGNPAAVVFVESNELQDADKLQKIASALNQPVTTFLQASTEQETEPRVASFDVRWFTPTREIQLCGHASIASSGLLFSYSGSVDPSLHTIRYKTTVGVVLTARRSGDWVDLTLPSAPIEKFNGEKAVQLSEIVRRGLRKDVHVTFAGAGTGSLSHFVFVEIGVEDDLEGCKPDPDVFLEIGYPGLIVTSASSEPNVAFISRMFAPALGTPEDHACGSSHSLLTPYWARKLLKEDSSAEMAARQVSERGGEMEVKWHELEEEITLSGQARVVARGELLLQTNSLTTK